MLAPQPIEDSERGPLDRNSLDRTEQRIVGVLVEKELSVPDTYPLTENALLAGCNQKNNRDPVMELERFQIDGALMSLRLKDWVAETEREGGRTSRYRHRMEERLGVDRPAKAVLCELLVRGPQTPQELKTRIGRLGVEATVEQVMAILEQLRDRAGKGLVELLPRAPRERDARWAHRLGPREPRAAEAPTASASAAAAPTPVRAVASAAGDAAPADATVTQRLAALERRVAELEALVQRLARP